MRGLLDTILGMVVVVFGVREKKRMASSGYGSKSVLLCTG
jgi:hypothetical protein